MTQEEKELLLKDLCGRLPYGVQYKDAHGYKKTLDIWSPEFHTALNTILYDEKPSLYLRPLSSMTEEEKDECINLIDIISSPSSESDKISKIIDCLNENIQLMDWFNKHHFDYRGLIDKGLALEAPENMYNIETIYNNCEDKIN